MISRQITIAPGARIEVRDQEWLVRRVDRTDTKGYALHVVGTSELVRDKEAVFLTDAEQFAGKDIKVLDPAKTALVPDGSPGFTATRLYVESLLRKTPPTGQGLYIGHRAAMDALPFQLEPAAMALSLPRQRILIADAVGLGKTITCGILLSELIRRGRGKRILVVATKSLLTQFQKEMWSRFTIPLTRLDSVGLQRVRNHIPVNHNPFHYYDRAIISVDTLKQDNEYRVHLENAYWDIIVIDEAHNVAERGGSASQRARLARLLSGRSDSLILLSATPHDGRARSFASLMNMLDPTAIADPDHYGPEDIQGLFIRRFKKDIKDQVTGSFKEREIRKIPVPASPAEEAAFQALEGITFHRLDQKRSGGRLFRTTLEKSLFSSPAACLDTVNNRIRNLTRDHGDDHPDISALEDFAQTVKLISPGDFSKFNHLVSVLTDKKSPLYWDGQNTTDRLVIFTERIETLNFLHAHLPRKLKLTSKQVATLRGMDSDREQQEVVEDFGKESSPIRLLIATDVASEGINLHYLCHRMIHFDIPWSLMVFQQRNGRIDRYGQYQTPQIIYLVTQSDTPKIKGDMRILELLIQKDEEAQKNIGDPSVFMGVYDEDQEEQITARAMEEGMDPEELDQTMDKNLQKAREDLFADGFDAMDLFYGDDGKTDTAAIAPETASMPSLFDNDFHFARTALDHLFKKEAVHTVDVAQGIIELEAPEDLIWRFRMVQKEMRPKDNTFLLTDRTDVIQEQIAAARKEENAWPRVHYLWEQHPVMEWLTDKLTAAMGRHQAPVICLDQGLSSGETIYLLFGLIPNRKGHPLIQNWFGISQVRQKGPFKGEDFAHRRVMDLNQFLDITGFGKTEIPNPQLGVDVLPLQKNLTDVIIQAKKTMSAKRDAVEADMAPALARHLNRLKTLEKRHENHIQQEFDWATSEKKDRRLRQVEDTFQRFNTWIRDTLETEDIPYIKVVAVFTRNDNCQDPGKPPYEQ
jgi:superfamily II DNA or RNA helicase